MVLSPSNSLINFRIHTCNDGFELINLDTDNINLSIDLAIPETINEIDNKIIIKTLEDMLVLFHEALFVQLYIVDIETLCQVGISTLIASRA